MQRRDARAQSLGSSDQHGAGRCNTRSWLVRTLMSHADRGWMGSVGKKDMHTHCTFLQWQKVSNRIFSNGVGESCQWNNSAVHVVTRSCSKKMCCFHCQKSLCLKRTSCPSAPLSFPLPASLQHLGPDVLHVTPGNLWMLSTCKKNMPISRVKPSVRPLRRDWMKHKIHTLPICQQQSIYMYLDMHQQPQKQHQTPLTSSWPVYKCRRLNQLGCHSHKYLSRYTTRINLKTRQGCQHSHWST